MTTTDTQRGRDPSTGKFLPGNRGGPGRRKGSSASSKRQEYLALMEKETPEVITKVLELAKGGDLTAIKLVLDRVMPIQSLQAEELEAQIEELRELVEEAQCQQSTH